MPAVLGRGEQCNYSTDSKVHQRPHANFRIRRGKCANAPLHIAKLTER